VLWVRILSLMPRSRMWRVLSSRSWTWPDSLRGSLQWQFCWLPSPCIVVSHVTNKCDSYQDSFHQQMHSFIEHIKPHTTRHAVHTSQPEILFTDLVLLALLCTSDRRIVPNADSTYIWNVSNLYVSTRRHIPKESQVHNFVLFTYFSSAVFWRFFQNLFWKYWSLGSTSGLAHREAPHRQDRHSVLGLEARASWLASSPSALSAVTVI
jgi:hypothetical protein